MTATTLPLITFLPDGRPSPPLLTPAEAVALLRISPEVDQEAAFRRIRAKYDHLLPACMVGRELRFRLADVLRVIDAIAKEPPRVSGSASGFSRKKEGDEEHRQQQGDSR